MHVRFLQVDGAKMSKSQGNFYTVRDLVDEKGVDPMALRYALLATPYGKPLNFTMQGLRDAAGNVERFREVERRIEAARGAKAWQGAGVSSPELERLADEILGALCEDLNTSVAIAKALEGVKHVLRESTLSESEAQAATWFLHRVNALLGIVRPENPSAAATTETEDVDAGRIEALIAERAEAKATKNFARADEIRKSLDAEGIELRDSPEGTTWVRKAKL
jgi:cysteinyl-tRNA synthetase